MKFGEWPVAEAVGAVLAHGVRAGDVSLRKGDALTPELAARLREAGVERVVAARLDADDVGENEAASLLAAHLPAGGEAACIRVAAPFTGRANMFATARGVLVVDAARIEAANAVDEAITVATLDAWRAVEPDEMVATVKIIPFAVPRADLQAATAAAGGALRVAPYRPRTVGMISTLLPGLKPSVVAKTARVLASRLEACGSTLASHVETSHDIPTLARALDDEANAGRGLVVVFGASAIADRRDVIPAALEAAGGRVEHLGMPVDPGNLLLLGELRGVPVLGAPGCARSPRENGFDWVLHRLLADLPVTRADIQRMGVGGLLMEIAQRPQPRSGDA